MFLHLRFTDNKKLTLALRNQHFPSTLLRLIFCSPHGTPEPNSSKHSALLRRRHWLGRVPPRARMAHHPHRTLSYIPASAARCLEPVLAACRVDVIKHLLKHTSINELFVLAPQLQCRGGVFNRVVGVLLNAFLEHAPSKKLEVEFALVFWQEEEVGCVNDLVPGDVDVDCAEVVG